MMSSVFNMLTSYRYVTRNDSSFGAMVRGFYRIIAGRHEDPLTKEEIQSGYILEPGNHIGVYDLVTLGIPWFIEAFLRVNWIRWELLRSILRFLSHQVVGLLILVRAILSGIVTLLALPILAVVYYLTKA